jgi:phage terminase small subunit
VAGRCKRLTPKQATFCEEYLIDLSATQAAIRAGYAPHTARSQGKRLLTKVAVKEKISELRAERSERTQISADRVLEELARIAFHDPREVMSWGPDGMEFKDSEELPEGAANVIAGLYETKTTYGTSRRIRFVDRLRALYLLGLHLGMFSNKVAASGAGAYGDGPIIFVEPSQPTRFERIRPTEELEATEPFAELESELEPELEEARRT